jgi:hypothetical protein
MYSKGEFKEVLFYKEDVLKQAEKTYHPENNTKHITCSAQQVILLLFTNAFFPAISIFNIQPNTYNKACKKYDRGNGIYQPGRKICTG